jgi:protein TonB
MGYQALLFCPDEKLARVVSQVFSDLDFTVEPVHEPFAAVKKLMTQRYDAVVVDCENEQNASLLFKSARNSGSNQSSLAIALVLGQAGVAKSYRIGANLVLTKPINVEQAKGTLRVARGLLRKNADAAGVSTAASPATPARTVPVPTGTSFQPAGRGAAAIDASPVSSEFELEDRDPSAPANPVIAASAEAVIEPELVPAHAAPIEPMMAVEQPAETWQAVEPDVNTLDVNKLDVTRHGAVSNYDAAAPSVNAQNTSSALASTRGSAAAPAPAKEVKAPPAREHKAVASEPAANSMSGYVGNAPSFSAFGEEDSEGSGGGKKFLIAAVVILALAALGYVGYGKFAKPGSAPASQPAASQPIGAPQNSVQPAPLAPASFPATAPSTSTSGPASSGTPTLAPKTTKAAPLEKPSAGTSNSPATNSPVASPVTTITIDPEPVTKKPASAPIVVKSNATGTKTKAQVPSEESAPQLPSPAADASANDSNLSSLVSVPSSLPTPSLATIKVSQGVSQGLVIKRVQPKYPAAALAVRAQGTVQIEATISKDGTVTNVKVLSGDAVLAHAAVEAVRQWRYKPYYLDGQPVEIETQISVTFKAN